MVFNTPQLSSKLFGCSLNTQSITSTIISLPLFLTYRSAQCSPAVSQMTSHNLHISLSFMHCTYNTFYSGAHRYYCIYCQYKSHAEIHLMYWNWGPNMIGKIYPDFNRKLWTHWNGQVQSADNLKTTLLCPQFIVIISSSYPGLGWPLRELIKLKGEQIKNVVEKKIKR